MRPTETIPEATPAPSATPEPTAIPTFTVTFQAGEEILSQSTVPMGQFPALPEYSDPTLHVVGWTDTDGNDVIPGEIPVTEDAAYTAVLRPTLRRDVRFLYGDIHGLFRPEDPWTRRDAARALYALMPDAASVEIELPDLAVEDPAYEACRWLAAVEYVLPADFDGDGTKEFGADQPMDGAQFAALLTAFFSPARVSEVMALYPLEETTLTRAVAAQWLCSLLEVDTEYTGDSPYYPDIAPDHELYSYLASIGAFTGYTAEDYIAKTLDSFLWFDGYLYRWNDETGYFLTDTTVDTLYYGKDGRYTCGDEEVDEYVAKLVRERCADQTERVAMLKKMHEFLRDECMYLVRNHYEPGDSHWALDEAKIMLSTGKGNCYSFAGALWALGRGLGYNTVVYSGTISKNYDPHGWTEIILDGTHYICDPEIQKQYWRDHLYYETFMLTYDNAVGWQYEAPNR